MKILLLLWLGLHQALAADPILSFSAHVQNEALAEESIDLLHCLADRTGHSWELGTDASPVPSVVVTEKDGKIEGHYRTEKEDKIFTLEKNGWRAACETLVPRPEISSDFKTGLNLDKFDLPAEDPTAIRKPKTWMWVAAGVAVVATGFFVWHSRQPDHRSLTME